ncbi:MAG: DUF1553 domain-containing protein [Planctomycetes bacterium]|nr:DUF1553 domain-containing protein [Planctomycetota bacterium]
MMTLGVVTGTARAEGPSRKVSFNRDVRPILSDNCFLCHGPDPSQRKAKLRLDSAQGAFAERDDPVIVPGKPAESTLYQRVSRKDGKRMPPASSGHALTAEQIDILRRWIEQGGKYEKHWSFMAPVRPEVPALKDSSGCKNAIDYFVRARLEKERMSPSPAADRATLIRRVTLDLTGLPPTPAEVDAYLADKSMDAYEKVVDRLLRSPRYGERMAGPWLDAARYADTNGYQTDGERVMWRWRDWVIDAFNDNMPFDRFTIEQIAGDMLPRPTLNQRIATGFNRNHRGNSEGGVIPEEYAVEYVVDRVDTTFTVWLGLTMGCCKCHDHKYDPLSQREFYQLFAYFNNVPERGKAIKYGNSPPFIKAPTRAQQAELRKLEAKLARAGADYAALAPDLTAAQRAWEAALDRRPIINWTLTRGLAAHFRFDGNDLDAAGATDSSKQRRGRFAGGEPTYVPGKLGGAAQLDGKRYFNAGDVGDYGFKDRFTLAAWVRPAGKRGGTILSRMLDTDRASGYSVVLQDGKVHVNLILRWLDDAIRVETVASLPADAWSHVAVSYDGSRLANGINVYIDGKPSKLKVNLDDLNQQFKNKEPFRIGAGGGPASRFHGAIDDVRIYDHVLPAEDVGQVAVVEPINEIVALAPEQRSPGQRHKLQYYFLETQAPAKIRQAWQRLAELRKEYEVLDDSIPTTMVMEEMATPRPTHILLRGEYDKKGKRVFPAVPASLPGLPASVPNNRLGLARWLVDRANPLTARVAVNRYWQMYFGQGLVRSVEDFGSQGEWPSHPELLDWLATEFMRSGWDVRHMQRLIVTSATYRQAARVSANSLARDPENRLLSRGPRLRLRAETIRDQALFASGLLVEQQGGPSVKPYQPLGLWRELADEKYDQDHGDKLYRRSLYTFWKRTIPPPAMMTFDSAGREACTVRQSRTNTPLQALNLMNDVTYVEAARVLAQRVMTEAKSPAERLSLAFRLVATRLPSTEELKILSANLEFHLAKYRSDRTAAQKLVSAGEAPRDPRLDVAEQAAYAAVAGLILNLDEAITKE